MSSTQSHLELLYEPDQNIFFVTDGSGNIADLEVDMTEEQRLCKTTINLLKTSEIFDNSLLNESCPEIIKHIIEKVYMTADEYHRIDRVAAEDPAFALEKPMSTKMKKQLLIAFNHVIQDMMQKKFGTPVSVDYF